MDSITEIVDAIIDSHGDTAREAQNRWREQAVETLRGFLGSQKPYKLVTTRDLWPLLDNPPVDRRGMVGVIHDLVQDGFLSRTTATVYAAPATTKDGVTFPFNKAVPQYMIRNRSEAAA